MEDHQKAIQSWYCSLLPLKYATCSINACASGFNSRYLQTLLPEIIHEVKIFTAKIDKSVGQTITLGDFITSLTIDIITAIVLGRSVNAQTEDGDLVTGFKGCIDWQIERERLNPFHLFNPLRPIAMSYYVKSITPIECVMWHTILIRVMVAVNSIKP